MSGEWKSGSTVAELKQASMEQASGAFTERVHMSTAAHMIVNVAASYMETSVI